MREQGLGAGRGEPGGRIRIPGVGERAGLEEVLDRRLGAPVEDVELDGQGVDELASLEPVGAPAELLLPGGRRRSLVDYSNSAFSAFSASLNSRRTSSEL